MKTPLALRNLTHERLRTAVAGAGVAFAVVLVLMQLGFLDSVRRTATLVFEPLEFDVALLGADYLHLGKPGSLALARLDQAAGVEAVRSATPLWVGFQMWRNPESVRGQRRSMMLIGIDPNRLAFRTEEIRAQSELIKLRGRLLVDRLSRSDFHADRVGVRTELGQANVEVAGFYTMGTGFAADGGALTSPETFRDAIPQMPANRTSIGLLRLDAQANPNEVAEALRRVLPIDTRVLTRAELCAYEEHHWLIKTAVGVIFGLGVFVALIVGLGVVYQVLSSDIAKRMAEFATLAAMGYPARFLSRVVLQQAALLAVVGYVPGLLLACGLFEVAAAGARIPMRMTWPLAGGVFVLCLAMCIASGWLALKKLRRLDPADLFG